MEGLNGLCKKQTLGKDMQGTDLVWHCIAKGEKGDWWDWASDFGTVDAGT